MHLLVTAGFYFLRKICVEPLVKRGETAAVVDLPYHQSSANLEHFETGAIYTSALEFWWEAGNRRTVSNSNFFHSIYLYLQKQYTPFLTSTAICRAHPAIPAAARCSAHREAGSLAAAAPPSPAPAPAVLAKMEVQSEGRTQLYALHSTLLCMCWRRILNSSTCSAEISCLSLCAQREKKGQPVRTKHGTHNTPTSSDAQGQPAPGIAIAT